MRLWKASNRPLAGRDEKRELRVALKILLSAAKLLTASLDRLSATLYSPSRHKRLVWAQCFMRIPGIAGCAASQSRRENPASMSLAFRSMLYASIRGQKKRKSRRPPVVYSLSRQRHDTRYLGM